MSAAAGGAGINYIEFYISPSLFRLSCSKPFLSTNKSSLIIIIGYKNGLVLNHRLFFCLSKRKRHPAAWPAASPALHGIKDRGWHNNEDRLVEGTGVNGFLGFLPLLAELQADSHYCCRLQRALCFLNMSRRAIESWL